MSVTTTVLTFLVALEFFLYHVSTNYFYFICPNK
ncbi:Uncharacterised protein [Aerococcus viridans]|nr:Uncharacterised protein [Aerococcus viridans]